MNPSRKSRLNTLVLEPLRLITIPQKVWRPSSTFVSGRIGGRVILSHNLWVEKGLVNGSMGTVRDISWSAGDDPLKDLPLAVIVQFDGYNGPTLGDTNG